MPVLLEDGPGLFVVEDAGGEFGPETPRDVIPEIVQGTLNNYENGVGRFFPRADGTIGGRMPILGRFEFLGHDHHAMVLQAEKEDVGNSARHEIRLYYRNQNRDLTEQLVLDPEIKQGPQLSEQSGSS